MLFLIKLQRVEWFGVTENSVSKIIPYLQSFVLCYLHAKVNMFNSHRTFHILIYSDKGPKEVIDGD